MGGMGCISLYTLRELNGFRAAYTYMHGERVYIKREEIERKRENSNQPRSNTHKKREEEKRGKKNKNTKIVLHLF